MKKRIILVIIILLAPILVLANDNYVIEESIKIKKDVKNYINNYSNFLKENTNISFYVILRNKKVEDYEINNYKYELNLGRKYILIIGVRENETINVKVGEDLSKRITEQEIEEILDTEAIPNIQKNDWDKALKNTYIKLFQKIGKTYNIDTKNMEIEETKGNQILISILLIIIGIILSGYACSYFKLLYNKRKKKTIIDYILLFISLGSNVYLYYMANELVSSILIVPIVLAQLTTILLSFNTPMQRKTKRKRGKPY